jgi:PAS domain S-box-containing protein
MVDDVGKAEPDPAEELAIHQGRAELALSAAGMGEFEWDFSRDLFIVSQRMADLTGLAPGVVPARGGLFALGFIHPDDVEAVNATVSERLIRDGAYQVRYRMIRPDDGRTQWMESSATILRGPGGPVTKVIGVVRDISVGKAEEDEREALVAELDHRVKNVLASVQSLAAQSARKTVSLEAFLKTLAGRLEAMAAAHALLTATRWRGARIADIAAAELGGLASGRALWSGPEMVLNPRATNTLTLALHELATNAVKYGALSSDAGRVEVNWRALAPGGFELAWVERGGPPVAAPTRQGFGVTLLERVTGRELGGEAHLEFPPEGARATLRASADALASGRSTSENPPPDAASDERGSETLAGASRGEGAADIRGVRVLIVEDSVLLALELEAGLIESGAQVVGVAADLDEARQMLSLAFDVAVLDADLAGRSVAPVANALAQRGAPFIFATGFDDAGVGAAPRGFDVPVVRKPYNVHQIAAALIEALGGAEASRRGARPH